MAESAPGPIREDDLIEIGFIGKPHGVRGGFHVDGVIDPGALVVGFIVFVGGNRYEISSRGGLAARPILSFLQIGSREAIQPLRGRPISAPRSTLTPLEDGEWFAKDLVGLRVIDRDGGAVGEVLQMMNAPSVDLLEVHRTDGTDLLIPMVRHAIVEIDPGAGHVIVDAEFLALGSD